MERLLDFSSDDPGEQRKSRCHSLSSWKLYERSVTASMEIWAIKISSAARTRDADLASGFYLNGEVCRKVFIALLV